MVPGCFTSQPTQEISCLVADKIEVKARSIGNQSNADGDIILQPLLCISDIDFMIKLN